MSGYGAELSGGRAVPDDMDLLAKPFSPKDLLVRVRAALEG